MVGYTSCHKLFGDGVQVQRQIWLPPSLICLLRPFLPLSGAVFTALGAYLGDVTMKRARSASHPVANQFLVFWTLQSLKETPGPWCGFQTFHRWHNLLPQGLPEECGAWMKVPTEMNLFCRTWFQRSWNKAIHRSSEGAPGIELLPAGRKTLLCFSPELQSRGGRTGRGERSSFEQSQAILGLPD